MTIIGKVAPRIYEYLRMAGKSSMLELKPTKVISKSIIKYDVKFVDTFKRSQDEIISAYREYARSPYVNSYLRQGLPLSEQSNKVVSCLREGINHSTPKTGKFYRGLSGCSDINEVKSFIFNNKGFTSVTPEINKNYAQTFVQTKKGALVEFDLKTPIKGFQDNNYEVVFDISAFTPEKYDISKIADGLYRVTEKVIK